MMAGSQTIAAVVAADAKPFKKGMKEAANSTKLLTDALKGIGEAVIAAFAIEKIVAFTEESIKAAAEARAVSRSLALAVENSNAFGKSKENIEKVTKALEAGAMTLSEQTGLSKETILGYERTWLAIGNVAKGGVRRVTKLTQTVADVAAGTGKAFDLVGGAFSKAFGDPKNALGKLLRLGVSVNQNEKDRYNWLLKQNQTQQALSYLLDVIDKKYSGQAMAAADPFARLQQSFAHFQENVGTAFLPIIDKTLPLLQDGLSKLALNSDFQQALQDIAGWLSTKLPKVLTWLQTNMPTISKAMKEFADAAVTIANILFPKVGDANYAAKQGAFQSGLSGKMDKLTIGQGAYMTYNVTINASSVDTSANTGKAIAKALDSYYRIGGRQVR